MSKVILLDPIAQLLQTQKLQHVISQNEPNVFIKGLTGASLSLVIAHAFESSTKNFLVVFDSKEEAAYHLNDLEQLCSTLNVLFFPASYRQPYDFEATDNANILLRSEVLNRINSQKKPVLIVSYPDALFEQVITRKELESNTLKIDVNEKVSLDFINEVLFEYHFMRVDFVSEPGEFSVRGGIVDVFSFANDEPYRIEFFGDEVDSIRTFDVATQRSLQQVKKIHIIPNIVSTHSAEKRQSFLQYMPKNTVVFLKHADMMFHRIDTFFEKAEQAFITLSPDIKHAKPQDLFCNSKQLKEQLLHVLIVEFGNAAVFSNSHQEIVYHTKPQPSFNKQFNLLIEDLNANTDAGITNFITCVNEQQAKRFHDIFSDSHLNIKQYTTLNIALHAGFIDADSRIACYTDHQIFERYHKFNIKNGYAKKQAITLKELNHLEIGDYVTHIDHGIGRFAGLQKIDVEGKPQEAIKLIYGERDVLYLSIHALHKITKYSGKEGKPPKIYKLGSAAWKTLKEKTKARVKHIAFNLIKLYAKRKAQKGYQYQPDSYMQHELEASFIYEDTPDQSKATADIKADMESDRPMDRLVCGDVGFGKTEVAIRAAFKAVDNGKQVAVLVPTTVLAYQHYTTFSSRLKEFPVTVNYLNRFRTEKERKAILEKLENGSIDIVIGTHQLVNKSIKFKDLGLLIVDEEQKFGVAVKDKLKTIKENIDVLTLTATPIPRTLQFSLMAARDLSVINTAPPNRFPIESHIIRFHEQTIRDAVSYEIQRGGQVFFIHNRIENINEVAGLIQRLVPDAKIRVGHGQLEGNKLEALMLDFMDAAFDVLVSTTIIESGLDVPNANTIFINNANNFGLSELHQMRGRVGRSNKKAFCYLITPEYSAMTDDARKRITALEQFTELGSGFNIAMKDLEIRGAGDLLGGEQSGFINDIGFDTYQKILNEAIDELKENEFKELYNQNIDTINYVKEVTIDSDFELLFPDDYINNVTERLNLYTQLNELKTEPELSQFEAQLKDRFGDLPTPVTNLLTSVRIKWLATHIGFEKIILKQGKLVGYFIADQKSSYFQSTNFSKVLNYVQQHSKICQIKEKQTRQGLRLLLTFENIKTVNQAFNVLEPILA